MTHSLGAMALLTFAAVTSGAQSSASSSKWQAWIGCWTAAPANELLLPVSSGPIVCVTPSSDDAVNVATIANGKVMSSQRIDASGTEQPVDAKGCSGTQRGQWSADGRRVFLRAVATCDGLRRTTSSLLGFTPNGEWLDVQEIAADSGSAVRVARYRDVGVPSTVPSEISSALGGRSMSTQGARIAAGAPIGTTAVIEASRVSTPAVVEAFVLERGERFSLDKYDLVALADAGVPGRVTDAMIAVSNPQAFAVAHNDGRAARDNALDDDVVGRRIPVYMEPSYGYYPYGYGYGYYNNFYGYNNYYGYGYGYPGYYYGSPIIVVNGSNPTQRGRLVKGHGYTPANGTPATPSTPSTSRGSTESGSRGAASEPSSSRTARPRP
ncbi:MAG TPA: hypothetical protein VGG78_01220 [Gemmatimonadaceae bacterium]